MGIKYLCPLLQRLILSIRLPSSPYSSSALSLLTPHSLSSTHFLELLSDRTTLPLSPNFNLD